MKMANQRIDCEKLEGYIEELNTLHEEITSYSATKYDLNTSGGSTIITIEAITEELQNMQDALALLVANTASYMQQRKESVDTKETEAAEVVSE